MIFYYVPVSAGPRHNTRRTAGHPPQSPTAVTMSAEEKKDDQKDQINLKVKDQVRGRLSPRRFRSSSTPRVPFKTPSRFV
jgi:hypothetical protein